MRYGLPSLMLSTGFAVALSAVAVFADNTDPSAVTETDRRRIVSIGGAVTETIYALGKGDLVIATDTTSSVPASVQSKPNVGYMRALSAEGVLSTNPTMIIATEGSGPRETMELLQSASLPLVIIPEDFTPEGLGRRIKAIGAAIGEKDKAADMSRAVQDRLSDLSAETSAIPDADRKKILFVLSAQDGRILAAGTDTEAHAMIEFAGGINVLPSISGYKPVSPEAISDAAPDVILVMTRSNHPYDIDALLKSPSLKRTPAGQNKHVVAMNGLYLLGFGPRTADAARDLAHQLHPDHIAKPKPVLTD
ncbi:heme/hemin ABC transporter substrate-binding protein [Coralliovum pocilloporae]|uniref:heme/hemin ABC transporter substrate-binding protein n=1 Tax=Coralliovum pocilloporae TaxID=3066369 RepID=UPI0033075564